MLKTVQTAGRVLFVCALVAFSAYAQQDSGAKTENYNGKEVAANEVLVKFHDMALTQIFGTQTTDEFDRVEEVGSMGAVRLHSASKSAATLIRELAARGDIEYAEPNYIVHAINTPNDPNFGLLWGLQNTGQTILGITGTPGADISAVPAWDVSTGSRANVVAVVDTGIDYRHPDLAANVWSAPAPFTVNIGGVQITCPAGSHGFNAITNACDPLDDNNHGTHVSGTIGAVGDNGIGVVGVNWTASIMGLKFLNASGAGTTADAIKAIEFAIETRAAFGGTTGTANVRVLSNSWGGGGFSQALLDEINKVNSNDMLFVAAAGNDGMNTDVTPSYPAGYNSPNILSVAATNNTDALADFSNYGATTVHLGAPGVNIASTITNNRYAYLSGTSMATPHVSGAALLVLSKCTALSTATLKQLLLDTTDSDPALTGRTITGGRLNVNKAIRTCDAPPVPIFTVSADPTSASDTTRHRRRYNVTATPGAGFSGNVDWTLSGLPSGATATFNPSSVAISGDSSASSTLTVRASADTSIGIYVLTVIGTSGAISRGAFVTLVVRAPSAPEFISLDADTMATGMSGDGSVVVGSYYGYRAPGFYWTAETGTVNIGGTGVGAISADGETIVGRAFDADGREDAAIWQGGTDWEPLGSFTPESKPCDTFLSSAYSVNSDASAIVGLGWDGCRHAHGFRWDEETGMTDLGSLVSTRASRANAISADGETIVGWSDQATGFRQGARWVDGAWEWFNGPYGAVGEAFAVNEDGSMIVGYSCGPSNEFAWLWTEETGVQCVNGTVAEPFKTSMRALSDDGRVIGGDVNPGFDPYRQAVLWLDGVPVDLRQYMLDKGAPEVTNWSLTSISAVSSDGRVLAGYGIGPDRRLHGFVITLSQQEIGRLGGVVRRKAH